MKRRGFRRECNQNHRRWHCRHCCSARAYINMPFCNDDILACIRCQHQSQMRDSEPRGSKRRCNTMLGFAETATWWHRLSQRERSRDNTDVTSDSFSISEDSQRRDYVSIVQPIAHGVTFSNAVSKLKAQSSKVSFHWNVAKETFELWALSFRKCYAKWDWLWDHFSDLVQNICLVRFSYLLRLHFRLSIFSKAPRDMRKFPQKCHNIAGCWDSAVYGSRPPIASKPDSSPPERPDLDNCTSQPWSEATWPCTTSEPFLISECLSRSNLSKRSKKH